MPPLTRNQRRKQKKDKTIYAAYQELLESGATKTAANEQVRIRFAIGSHKTVNTIIKRVENRLSAVH